jgi:5-methyltetrahydropteroyltriglutamate--homocysteine methyltransferase
MLTHTLGFPRIGRDRELKKAVESHWRGEIDSKSLLTHCAALRSEHWRLQRDQGIDLVPVGDFSLYDHVLDAAVMLGCVPERFKSSMPPLEAYFLMARGGQGTPAMEMTKWFNTNYHYIVPEFAPGQTFSANPRSLLEQAALARAEGFAAKVVIPGPFTFVHLGKAVSQGFDKWTLLDGAVRAYTEVIEAVSRECAWIELDEPVLACGLPEPVLARFPSVYGLLRAAAGGSHLMLATYFGGIGPVANILTRLPVDCLHVDLTSDQHQFNAVCKALPRGCSLSLGLVDGRNIWRTDMQWAMNLAGQAAKRLGMERLMIAPSCSLLHVPVDLDVERGLDPEIKSWMAFAKQKCAEVRLIADALMGRDVGAELAECAATRQGRLQSPKTVNPVVRERAAGVTNAMQNRASPFPVRAKVQRQRFMFPELPTTTIGSFPQTQDIRSARARFKSGALDEAGYKSAMRDYIGDCIGTQERIGLDVLVHGEPERNDMVEYFGEQMDGFCFTSAGWVQSYGTRCVKPPVIYGDILRPGPMTVGWTQLAQSMTTRPVKGMLTGPVTILCWSFVRDDLPRSEACRQIALAIRDEVADLEAAGIGIIQIDEPALREGLPLAREAREPYLSWAVECFRLASSGVRDETQIHTHMCYAEFNEIVEWIAAMDADVISIEASRSDMVLLEAFAVFRYPSGIGPGIWDIHSPRVPSVQEMVELLEKALKVIDRDKLWVNPDCGLKTRDWPEVLKSLENMVEAALLVRRLAL